MGRVGCPIGREVTSRPIGQTGNELVSQRVATCPVAGYGRAPAERHKLRTSQHGTGGDAVVETANATPGSLMDLDERPLSRRLRYAAVLVACGEFIDGYDLIVMGAALILPRPRFHLSPAETGALSNETTLLFSSLVWCTSLVGVLVGLVLIDRIGRSLEALAGD
jgi:hypothetical protein